MTASRSTESWATSSGIWTASLLGPPGSSPSSAARSGTSTASSGRDAAHPCRQPRPGDRLLVGTDLVKDREQLEAAYNDSAGVTAEFNRNVLHVLNTNLGADLSPTDSSTPRLYDEDGRWIEMRLRSLGESTERRHRGARHGRRGSTRRGHPHRDLVQVHPPRASPRILGCWTADGELAHRRATASSPCLWPRPTAPAQLERQTGRSFSCFRSGASCRSPSAYASLGLQEKALPGGRT